MGNVKIVTKGSLATEFGSRSQALCSWFVPKPYCCMTSAPGGGLKVNFELLMPLLTLARP